MGARRNVRPDELADRAAEAIRSLNHATLGAWGYSEPAEVDAVFAHLSATVAGMPQVIAQAMRWLFTAQAAGRLGHDEPGADLDASLRLMSDALMRAAARIESGAEQNEVARRVTGHLKPSTPTDGMENRA